MKNEEARHVPSSLSLACYFEDITLLLEAESERWCREGREHQEMS